MNNAVEGLAAIRDAIADKVTDDFTTGDVIRWTVAGKYTYAALKCGDGNWYSTSLADNNVPLKMPFTTLLKVLQRSEVAGIAMSTAWADVK